MISSGTAANTGYPVRDTLAFKLDHTAGAVGDRWQLQLAARYTAAIASPAAAADLAEWGRDR